MCNHLSILILDCLHDEDLTISILDGEGVPLGYHLLAYVGDEVLLLSQGKGCFCCIQVKIPDLLLCAASTE